MSQTEYITAKVPAHLKQALDAITRQRRMQDGSDIRRSELIREALLDFIDKAASEDKETRQAIEEATSAANNNAR